VNYFEHYPIVTALHESVSVGLGGLGWYDLKVNQLVTVTVEKVEKYQNFNQEQSYIKVSLGAGVHGIVDFLNIADKPAANFQAFKRFKEQMKVQARVLLVQPLEKVLRLSVKPTFLDENV